MEFSIKDLQQVADTRKAHAIISIFRKGGIKFTQKMIRNNQDKLYIVNCYKIQDALDFFARKSTSDKTNQARMRNYKIIKELESEKRNEIQTLEA